MTICVLEVTCGPNVQCSFDNRMIRNPCGDRANPVVPRACEGTVLSEFMIEINSTGNKVVPLINRSQPEAWEVGPGTPSSGKEKTSGRTSGSALTSFSDAFHARVYSGERESQCRRTVITWKTIF